ncbi:MAG: biotin--[acetyl-CoA-carboxylase] ligase [Armatimonadetes bacterium]|nr:biotin--[acetyl-CoA-carboxylase] ligase [Armatimonadota bacterium]
MRYSIHRFDSVASTNDLAARMAGDGAPEGTVVAADEQSAGRGRLGRRWISPPDSGLYLSIVLRPQIPADSHWQLAFVCSLAVAEAVRAATGLAAQTKWPNDVLLNGRKVAGVLVERCRAADGAVIAGIGINVNTADWPAEIAESATSILLESLEAASRPEIERAVLDALDARYEALKSEGFSPILDAWRGLDCTVGREVEVRAADGVVRGVAAAVSESGSLIVRSGGGALTEISAGDVLLAG